MKIGYNLSTLTVLKFILIIVNALLLGAHFLRMGNVPLTILPVASLALLFVRRSWVRLIFPFLLLATGLLWVHTAVDFTIVRRAFGMPWMRMALIIGAVALFAALSALVFSTKKFKEIYSDKASTQFHSAVAFVITAIILSFIQLKVERPMLLLERFLSGAGWFEVLMVSIYAAWIAEKMADVSASATWRRRIWIGFSVVFFGQALLGVLGVESLLMTGSLHVPVPAVIVGGPLFRFENFFMPILLFSTLALVGPAWCSHLCYFGALDQLAADQKKRPEILPSWAGTVRFWIFALVVVTAIGLRFLEVSGYAAAIVALSFGALGIGVTLVVSKKLGVMVHCVVFCPIGVLANYIGKISPFRVSFKSNCDGCGACGLTCKYAALTQEDIQKRKVGITCTLCGDCLGSCKKEQLEYRFLGFTGTKSRSVFIVLIVALHAICMAVARI